MKFDAGCFSQFKVYLARARVMREIKTALGGVDDWIWKFFLKLPTTQEKFISFPVSWRRITREKHIEKSALPEDGQWKALSTWPSNSLPAAISVINRGFSRHLITLFSSGRRNK